jgi:hypothetical protein
MMLTAWKEIMRGKDILIILTSCKDRIVLQLVSAFNLTTSDYFATRTKSFARGILLAIVYGILSSRCCLIQNSGY